MPLRPPLPDTVLDAAQRQADPLADATVSAVLDPWPAPDAPTEAAPLLAALAPQWERIAQLNRAISQWETNADLANWHPDPDLPAATALALRRYLDAACLLPDWADAQRIARAETLFYEQGLLSVLLLFCASLPECYVVPDLAEVLHTTGQLEQRTDHRIRSTAAMVFPVMMKGGLTDPAGTGVAQVLKVRLIHAMVRHLILRGTPEAALMPGAASQPRLALAAPPAGMHQALFAHGWDTAAQGLPNNQEEQAYTLLTFGYVTLRGMRTLGLRLPPQDQEAVLHAWNVVGHLVGVRDELMAHTMDDAAALFAQLQARGRAEQRAEDARPALAGALFATLAREIPWRVARPFPLLLSRWLIGAQASADLQLDGRVGLGSRVLFALGVGVVGAIDAIGRLFSPQFSLARALTRILGVDMVTRLLMSQTRPLKLPAGLQSQTRRLLQAWGGTVQ